MKVAIERCIAAYLLLFVRCWGRWYDAWRHIHGIGAYRPYAFEDIELGEFVRFSSETRTPKRLIVGRGYRAHMPVAAPDGSLACIHLDNGGQINSVSFMRSYRFLDGTVCGKYDPFARQKDVDEASEITLRAVSWA
jgi:hypothetical protein